MGAYVYGQAGSKSKDATLWVPVHTRARTRTRLACLLFEAKSHCALCPVLLQHVLYVCRLGVENL